MDGIKSLMNRMWRIGFSVECHPKISKKNKNAESRWVRGKALLTWIDIRSKYPSSCRRYSEKYDICLLCKTELGKTEDHSDSYQHKFAVEEISDRATQILQVRDDARLLPRKVEQRVSPYGPWQGKIYEMIGRAVMKEDPTIIQEANRLLLHYKRLERISLLELAVWKFTCVVTDDTHTGPCQTYLEWKQWDTHGWKTLKKQHYRCNQVVILMTAIVPFLKNEQGTKEYRRDCPISTPES